MGRNGKRRSTISVTLDSSQRERPFNPFDLPSIHNVIPPPPLFPSTWCLSPHTIFAPSRRQFGRFFKIRFEVRSVPFPFDNTHLSPPYHAPWYANSTSLCYTFESSSIRKRCLLSKTERWITNFPSHPPGIRTNRTQNPISLFRSGTSPRSYRSFFAVTTTGGLPFYRNRWYVSIKKANRLRFIAMKQCAPEN